jgi:hypothetical protein
MRETREGIVTDTAPAKSGAPWHLWVVGVVSLLWNAFGCYDYYMTNTGGDEYLRSYGMTEQQIAFYHAMPAWMTGAWAIGVWGALLGSILLLLRSKWAFHVFVISFAAFLVSVIYTYGFTNVAEVNGATGMIMNVVIAASCIFFIWYAWFATTRGILR